VNLTSRLTLAWLEQVAQVRLLSLPFDGRAFSARASGLTVQNLLQTET